jgi:hypothetical protein
MFVRANLSQVLYARNTNLRCPRRPAFANALAAAHPGYQSKLIDTLVMLVYKSVNDWSRFRACVTAGFASDFSSNLDVEATRSSAETLGTCYEGELVGVSVRMRKTIWIALVVLAVLAVLLFATTSTRRYGSTPLDSPRISLAPPDRNRPPDAPKTTPETPGDPGGTPGHSPRNPQQ